jgi:SAM-dependent methyltransferase
MLFKTVDGLEKIASKEISEKLRAKDSVIGPYGRPSWISCWIEDHLVGKVRALRSAVEAHILVHDERYGESFSIDTFADRVVEAISSYVPNARAISVSAYSVRGMPSQRELQGAFSKRIVSKLGARCNLRDYDTALRISLLKRIALASIDLEIQPGNIPKIETHPTPLFPPIAYCMIRLTSPQDRERLLDPMCGCGTIPLMAALEWINLQVIGSDISGDYIGCATRNAETLRLENKVRFLVSDLADLHDKGVSADIIAVNPPYGIAVRGYGEAGNVYANLIEKASRILPSGGRIAVITPYPSIIDKLVSRWMFRIKSIWNIREGELPRTIHIIQKS